MIETGPRQKNKNPTLPCALLSDNNCSMDYNPTRIFFKKWRRN